MAEGPSGELHLDDAGKAAQRVRAFLSHVQERTSLDNEQLNAANENIRHLRDDIVNLRSELDERQGELEHIKEKYLNELRTRGEKAAALTQDFIQEKLGDLLDDVRTRTARQFEERVNQLQQTLDMRDDALKQARQDATLLRTDIEQIRADAADQLDSLRDRQAEERREFNAQLQTIREEIEKEYSNRIRDLESTLREQNTLAKQATDAITPLHSEIERMRRTFDTELAELQEKRKEDAQHYEQKITHLQARTKEVTDAYENLKNIVTESEDVEALKEFETRNREMQQELAELEESHEVLREALVVIKQLHASSPAARSILKNAGDTIDFESLFEELE